MSDAKALIKLQEIDLEVLRLKKKLDEMPQIEAHRQVVAKIAEINEKSKQISAIRSECEVEMQKLIDEDEELVKKADEIQAKVDENESYRNVASLTQELESIAKRRNKVEFDHGKLVERVDKVSSIEDQIAETLTKLEAQKTKLESEMREMIGEVNEQLAEHKIEHEHSIAKIPKDLADRYEHLKTTKNGIAVGILQDNHCSACRVEFPDGKLLQLAAGPEVTTCPQCHRILVVLKDE